MSRIRRLPLHREPRPGEGIDSWIEALAARHGIAPALLLPRLGIPAGLRRISRLYSELTPRQVADAETAVGLAPGSLGAITPGRVTGSMGWLRTGGSRFCPQCLTETDGLWPLQWRSAWVFACLRHRRLLRDTCGLCAGTQRTVLYAGRDQFAAWCCPRTLPVGRRCRADLREAAPGRVLTPTLTATVQWIESLTAGLEDPEEYPRSAAVFADLPIVALWLARRDARHGVVWAGELVADPIGRVLEARLHRDVELTAIILSRARHVMSGPEPDAITHVRAILREEPGLARIPPPGMTRDQWYALASGFETRVIRAADPDLGAIDRLRMKSMTITPVRALRPVPGAAAAVEAQPPVRAKNVPQLLWPDWSARLLPAAGLEAELFRAVMSVCLLIPAASGRALAEFAAQFSPRIPEGTISLTLQFFRALPGSPSGHALTEVLAILCRLADHLDTHGSPIDYQRRREQISAAPIDWPDWCEVATGAGTQPGTRPGRARHVHAQRYLNQLLTGADLADPAHPLAFTGANDRTRYLDFTLRLIPRLRQGLREHAAGILARHGIDEPVAWSPPATLAANLPFPGVDIDAIDLEAVRQMIVEEGRPVAHAAKALAVNTDHIRLAVERIEWPQAQWSIHGPDAWRRRAQAPGLLTREFFEREYVHGGRRLNQIAKETGYSRHVLAGYAKGAGIALANAVEAFPIDADWLREQYHERHRPITDIARELATTEAIVNYALHRLGITPRPPGVHSFPAMLTKLPPGTPRAIRHAVEGTLHGWERLRRFQIAMRFPTVTTAGAYLGITHCLLTVQFQRLEAHLGATLFTRAVIGKAQQPTRSGARLLHQLEREEVAAMMADALNGRAGFNLPPADVLEAAFRAFAAPQRPRPPRAPAPFDDIPLPRFLIGPATLTLLRHLLTEPGREFYGLEVHQATGIDQGTLYPLLKKLEKAGWLTARPEDEHQWRTGAPPGKGPGKRRTYYRLTPNGHRLAQREVEHVD